VRICVYTVLLGGYDTLLEQVVAANSKADFLCFSDSQSIVSETWRLERVDPLLPQDLHRSSREYKILGHPVLQQYDVTICIDASVLLRSTPEQIVAQLLPEEFDMALLAHSYRDTVLDEFDEVVRLNYDDRFRVYEQLTDYAVHFPEALDARPLWGGMLIRRNTQNVADAMRIWFYQVLRYSRRDQLSLPFALQTAGLTPHVVELDNFQSELHEWPVITGRKIVQGKAPAFAHGPMVAELRRAVQRIKELEAQLADCEPAAVAALRNRIAQQAAEIEEGFAERVRLEQNIEGLRRRQWELEYVAARRSSMSRRIRKYARALAAKLTRGRLLAGKR
jgi:hypothetical protein